MPIIVAQATPPAVIAAPPPGLRPSVVTSPDWLRKPTGEDLAKFYPKAAAAARVEGRATIHCKVAETGSLTDCVASNEDPAGQGFADAALQLAPYFMMRPMTKDGVPVSGGQINIPIRFMLPKSPPPADVALRCYGYAAAEAERNPASEAAQAGAFLFGLLIQVRLMPEKARPSELAEVLVSQRQIAASKIDDPKFKAERDQCASVLPGDAKATLQNLFGNLTR